MATRVKQKIETYDWLDLIQETLPDTEEEKEEISFWEFVQKYSPEWANYEGEYKYLKEPIEALLKGEDVVMPKGSQTGATTALLMFVLYLMVVVGDSVFYMMPTADDVSDLSASRLNAVIENSEDLESKFSYDNVHHKRYEKANLYLRGSRSPSKLKSVPVSRLVIDERDEIQDEVCDIVEERLSGQKEKQKIQASTPTERTRGIWKEYEASRKRIFKITCCHCNKRQEVTFDNNVCLKRRSFKCTYCDKLWTQQQKIAAIIETGKYEKENPDEEENNNKPLGFHIPQLLSPTVSAEEIVSKYEKADNELKKQTFFNHKLGLPYSAEGSKLDSSLIDLRVGEIQVVETLRCAGMDVSQSGPHYLTIAQPFSAGPIIDHICRVTWEDIPSVLEKWKVASFVIDANPERKKARETITNLKDEYGILSWMALYPRGLKKLYVVEEEGDMVRINRTEVIDVVLDRYRNDTVLVRELCFANTEYTHFCAHHCNVVRRYREVQGDYEAYYEENGADHYLHSACYMEIANRLFSLVSTDKNEQQLGSFI